MAIFKQKRASKTEEIKAVTPEKKVPEVDVAPKEISEENEVKVIPSEIERYEPDLKTGLTQEQVEKRQNEYMTNKSYTNNTKTVGKILVDNIFTFFNMLLLAIAILLIIFGQYTQLTFLVIAVINTIIGIYQELRAKKTIDKLRLITTEEVKVIRDGAPIVINTNDLVLDDIYQLKIGEQIPTDSILKEGRLEVNESLLTGESRPIVKNVGDKVYAGSFVVSGSATVQTVMVGDYNYVAGIQAKAKELTKPKSELVRSLNLVIKIIGFIIIPLGALTFWTQWVNFYNAAALTAEEIDLWEVAVASVKATAGSMVGMIPSGMYLLTSVALASSILTLSKKNALVQNLYSVEMLARVNVLCLDKTGTLTDGTMKVEEILMVDASYDMNKLIGSYLNAFSESNQTTIALSQRYPLRKDYRIVTTIPFSSERKYSAVEFDEFGTFSLGAPEYIFKGKDKTINDYIASKQASGYRVIMLCHSDSPIISGEIKGRLTPVAVFSLEDHIREDAPATIDWFVKNGVDIKIISGDNPLTASEIALKSGVPNAENCISLEGLSEREVRDIVNTYAVFGRVSPEQKAIIIDELKSQGKTVGMTGDGVNDILAMKKADCSVAMANGSSAARNCANLVLLDSNFASMPVAVQEGRRAINNVQRSSALYLMKTIFTIVFTIIVLFTYVNAGHGIAYPFDPNNLLVTEMICIGFTSVFLAVQKNDAPIKGHFLKNTFMRAVPAAFCLVFAIGLNYILLNAGNFLELPMNENGILTADGNLAFKTLNSLSMTAVALGMAYNCCLPLFPLSNPNNRYRAIMFGITILFVCIMVFGFGMMPGTNGSTSLGTQLIGIDFTKLNKIMWLLLIIYLTGVTSLLSILVRIFTGTSDEKSRLKREKPNKG